MTGRQSRSGRVLAGVGAALLLAACGGGTKVGTGHSAGAPTTSTSAAAAPGPSQAQAPATTAGRGAPGTQAPSPAAPAGTVAPTGAAVAGGSASSSAAPAPSGSGPAPGTYKFQSTDSKGNVSQLSVNVKTNSSSGSTLDQTLTISSPQGSEKSTYAWNPTSGVMVSATSLGDASGSVTCNWSPDVSQYVFGLGNGSSWSSLSHCQTSIAGAPASATYDNRASVTGHEQIRVAGRSLDTWVIHRTAVLTAKSATFDLTITTVSTEYYAPSDGLTPRELTDTTTSGSYTGKSFNQETKATIEAETLTPS